MECVEHPDSCVVSVCATCSNATVCLDCITGSHTGHVFIKPDVAANDIKSKLQSKKVEDEKYITELQSDIHDAMTVKAQQEGQHKTTISKVNSQRGGLHQVVDDIADRLIAEHEANNKDNCDMLENAIADISATFEKVKRHNCNLNRLMDEKDDLTVVRDSARLGDVVNKRTPCPKPVSKEFTPGKMNVNHLKLMVGGTAGDMDRLLSLQRAQVEADFSISTAKGSDFEGTIQRHGRSVLLESTITNATSMYVVEMQSWSYTLTWCRCIKGEELKLINKNGEVEKNETFDHKVIGLTRHTTSGTDTLLVCGIDDREIKQVALSSGNITSAFSTGKLYPYHICRATSGDLYITLVDKEDYKVTSDSERFLVQYSQYGTEKRRAFRDGSGDPMFVRPSRMRISNTGDVVGVLNGTDNDNSHLVLLNADLTLRSRYLGDGKVVSGEHKFGTTTYRPAAKYLITDFLFTSFDNTIICESYSRCVQLLSRDCLPMLTILSQQEHIPRSLALNGDEMWIGFQEGTVNVYKHR